MFGMKANIKEGFPISDAWEVLRQGQEELSKLLPPNWQVVPVNAPGSDDLSDPLKADTVIALQGRMGSSPAIAVEARTVLIPRDVGNVLGGQLSVLRRMSPGLSVLVMAPWLSPRTRDLLAERGFHYLDLTGNASITLEQPGFVIRTTGANEDPAPTKQGPVGLGGKITGRVVRLIADVRPPYSATVIAQEARVSLAQVSRVLATLDREALVQRKARGLVTEVDWPNLLRRRADTYRFFEVNRATAYFSGAGANSILERLRGGAAPYLALTGSAAIAAGRFNPITAGGQLMLYVRDPKAFASALGLLPAPSGGDVTLLVPYDSVTMERARQTSDGLTIVAPTQLALDSLGGSGRMPAEGEALIEWMAAHEEKWRLPSVQSVQSVLEIR